MPKRRGRGEGGVSKTPYGKWRAFYVVESDSVGDKRKRVTKVFTEKPDALAWLSSQKIEHAAGRLAMSGSMTVGEWFATWKAVRKSRVGRRTGIEIEEVYNRCIGPYLAAERLDRLTAVKVMGWYRSMAADGIPADRQKRGGSWLRSILKGAVSAGLMPKNPAADVEKPKTVKAEMVVWDRDESRAFLQAIADYAEPYRTLFRFLLDTGCRPSEAYALRWSDYDQATGRIRIQRAVERGKNKSECRIKETKTAAGRRSVLLSGSTRKSLDALPRKSDLIFDVGEMVHHETARDKFLRIIEKIPVRPIRFYDLRHTSATLLLQAGVNVKVIAERLGHSDPAMTLRAYAHVIPSMQETAAAAAESLWG
jgi:integrase